MTKTMNEQREFKYEYYQTMEEIKKMVKDEMDKQMKFYLKELTKIRVKLADLEIIIDRRESK